MSSSQIFTAATSCSAADTGNDRDAIVPTANCRSVLIVADGAQGRQGGVAADIAIAYVKANAEDLASAFSAFACRHALEAIDQEIFRHNSGGLTTGVLIALECDRFVGASVGDTEAHLVRAHDVLDITGAQPRKPFLGSGSARPSGFGPLPLEGRLLVATDGLFKYGTHLLREEIVRTAPIREVPWRLVDAVRLPNGNLQDDVTVYVVETWDGIESSLNRRPSSSITNGR